MKVKHAAGLSGHTRLLKSASVGFVHHFTVLLATFRTRFVVGARNAAKLVQTVDMIAPSVGDTLTAQLEVHDEISIAATTQAIKNIDVLINYTEIIAVGNVKHE